MSTKKSPSKSNGFTDEERDAMRARAREVKADASRGPRGKKDKGDGVIDAEFVDVDDKK